MNTAATSVDDLVVSNLALVGYAVSELLRRVPPSVARDDLASAGSLALVLAARSYDPSTGVPFARYASLRIRGALLDELRSMDWATRGSRTRVRELAATTEQLAAALGRPATRDEIATALGVDVRAVDQIRADADRRVLSIDASEGVIADMIVDGTSTPEEAVLATERVHWLRAAVDTLPDRLQVVVRAIFLEDRSVADLADELGVTQSRISQLRTEALGMLRDGLNTHFEPTLVPAADRPDGVAERRRQTYFASIASRAALTASDRLSYVPEPSASDEHVVSRQVLA
ncbi:sigma-70 family RNA polymerase sigma factor [Cellulomonas rhizosphaerae]|uniref:Sigma-70 family RNA polymerase sigma factor n=1 Tax=Cellulomonas rhizosphaerae TaxID=2293719 RepID=A0A413RPU8_9CELL|nr:sigma-70 family RNA polymerase sigma factor [Cellulomonas rhizosphaerae]RHA44012.1 sigma-70 family RNA polymerase sigma factor [Cellulomonas rhizosphaerae]